MVQAMSNVFWVVFDKTVMQCGCNINLERKLK